MAKAILKDVSQMKFPWMMGDGSGDISDDSDETDFTDYSYSRGEYSTKQFICNFMEEMKMYLSDQLSKTKLHFMKSLRTVESEATRKFQYLIIGTEYEASAVDMFICCTPRYQKLLFDMKQEEFLKVDMTGVNQLLDLIEYLSFTRYLDLNYACSITNFNTLQSEFDRFCTENEKLSGELKKIRVELNTSLDEITADIKLLIEYIVRDLFVISEHGSPTFDELQELNLRLKSLCKLKMHYFNPLKIKMKSLAHIAESFNCVKERFRQCLQDCLRMEICNVQCT